MKLIAIAALLFATAAPALADKWEHASAPMGQYEGGLSMDNASYGINYHCSGMGTTISLYAEGLHVAKGESTLMVGDKNIIDDVDTTFSSRSGYTNINYNVKPDYGVLARTEMNKAIAALRSGMEAVWTTPSGKVFTLPLKNSAQIKVCKMQ